MHFLAVIEEAQAIVRILCHIGAWDPFPPLKAPHSQVALVFTYNGKIELLGSLWEGMDIVQSLNLLVVHIKSPWMTNINRNYLSLVCPTI